MTNNSWIVEYAKSIGISPASLKSKYSKKRRQWIKDLKSLGPIHCVFCGIGLQTYNTRKKDYLTVDHVVEASVRPDLYLDPNNWAPACGSCNLAKDIKRHGNLKGEERHKHMMEERKKHSNKKKIPQANQALLIDTFKAAHKIKKIAYAVLSLLLLQFPLLIYIILK